MDEDAFDNWNSESIGRNNGGMQYPNYEWETNIGEFSDYGNSTNNSCINDYVSNGNIGDSQIVNNNNEPKVKNETTLKATHSSELNRGLVFRNVNINPNSLLCNFNTENVYKDYYPFFDPSYFPKDEYNAFYTTELYHQAQKGLCVNKNGTLYNSTLRKLFVENNTKQSETYLNRYLKNAAEVLNDKSSRLGDLVYFIRIPVCKKTTNASLKNFFKNFFRCYPDLWDNEKEKRIEKLSCCLNIAVIKYQHICPILYLNDAPEFRGIPPIDLKTSKKYRNTNRGSNNHGLSPGHTPDPCLNEEEINLNTQ